MKSPVSNFNHDVVVISLIVPPKLNSLVWICFSADPKLNAFGRDCNKLAPKLNVLITAGLIKLAPNVNPNGFADSSNILSSVSVSKL